MADHVKIFDLNAPATDSPFDYSSDGSIVIPQIIDSSTLVVRSQSEIETFLRRRFSSFENELRPFMQDFAVHNGFILARKGHRMDAAKATQFFQQESVMQRGHFYCTSAGNGLDSCPFRVPFTFDFASAEYIIKRDGLNLEHNHVAMSLIVDNILFKQRDVELTDDERETILEMAPYVTIPTLRRYLRSRWPSVSFTASLLYRLKAKGKEKRFGADKDAINSFMTAGVAIRAESGIFDVHFDESMRIEEVFIQKASMVPYAMQYGDFTIVDGTFCISMYDLVLMIFSNVDCLLKTTITTMALAPSERSGSAIRAARRFSLATEGSVLMTDQASAFATMAEELKQVHVLCLHHFRTAMFSAHGGMVQDVRNRFLQIGNHLLFNVCETIAAFTAQLQSAIAEFSSFPDALKFLKSVWENRERVCATYTSAFFTAGHVATQRGESNNSRVKEGGQFKKDLSSYNLNQVLEHTFCIIRQQEAVSKKAIKDYVKAGSGWCKEVGDIWKSENNLANNYESICVDDANQVWQARRYDGSGFSHTIRLLTNAQSYPSCDCKDFTSRLIPCRHICATYSRITRDLFNLQTLHPRWWIKNHPQFPECLSELGLSMEIAPLAEIESSLDPVSADFHLELLQQIRVPSTRQVQYRRLDEVAKELVSVGSSKDDYTFRFVMNGLTSLLNATKALKDDQPVENFGGMPPTQSKRQSVDENLSRCAWKGKKQKVMSCRVCVQAGRTDAAGHRSNSSKCPLFRGKELNVLQNIDINIV